MPPIMDIPCYQVRAVVPSPQQGRPGPRPHRHGIASWPLAQVAAKPYVLLRKWIWPNDWRISHLLPAPDATRCGLVPLSLHQLTSACSPQLNRARIPAQ